MMLLLWSHSVGELVESVIYVSKRFLWAKKVQIVPFQDVYCDSKQATRIFIAL